MNYIFRISRSDLQALANRRLFVTLLLGFSSGLPLALSGATLQAWLADVDIDIRSIGYFSLVGLPYALKFLWSPFMDRFVPPRFGRRRGWLLITQLLLVVLIVLVGSLSPHEQLNLVMLLAFCLAFVSASQDIAVDAYRTDILKTRERGLGAALAVGGYRIALLCAGAGAMILADQIGWQLTYWSIAALLFIGIFATLIGPLPAQHVEPPRTLREAVIAPFHDFLQRRAAVVLLVFIVLYKFGDAFAGTLTTAFLIQGLDFTITDVGLVGKGFGLAATLFGALFGGLLMVRLKLYRALLVFGVLQAVTNLVFAWLAVIGKSYWGMATAVGLENLAGGMGTAAFVALLMTLCNQRYTATQFALLSALAAVGRVIVGPPAGELVHVLGWAPFFYLTFLLALPGLFLLIYLRPVIDHAEQVDNA
ncbi:MAG: MFS transporter [Gammaproteobacteria bacterium]|nr:MFS transporter [Gammaproteobacteria bacterium]